MDSRFVVMQLRCDAFLQFCPFRLKQHYLLGRIRLRIRQWLDFILQMLDRVMCISGTGLYTLVFRRFLPRWFCRDFVLRVELFFLLW